MSQPTSTQHDISSLADIIQGLPDLFTQPQTRQTGIDEFKKVLQRIRAAAPLIPPRRRSLQLAESERFRADFAKAFSTTTGARPLCLLLSDSIALPRQSIGVQPRLTYPFIVQQTLDETGSPLRIEPDCMRGRTIVDAAQSLATRTDNYTTFPEHLVLQLGIVDCAPRVFLERDIEIVTDQLGKPAADILIRLASRYRPLVAGNPATTVYVQVDRFAASLADMLRRLRATTTIHVITIVTPIKLGARNDKSPLGLNIRAYNDVIRAAANSYECMLVDADKAIWSSHNPASCFTNDNYHFNANGHQFVATELLRSLGETH